MAEKSGYIMDADAQVPTRLLGRPVVEDDTWCVIVCSGKEENDD